MQPSAQKYLSVETFASGVSNALLNLFFAWLLFRGRSVIPTAGPRGLLQDSIGETVFVVFLSTLIPALIARSRRRAGTLPVADDGPLTPPDNIYLRSAIITVIFTAICFAFNAFILPRVYPDGISFRGLLTFKTVYGTIFGVIATYFALRRALRESATTSAASDRMAKGTER